MKKLIAGNWKMNMTAAEGAALIARLKAELKPFRRADICVCVPFTSIAAAKKAARGSKIKIGAQNVAWAESGAFTGEVSAQMLSEAGAEYAVIGHSERRQMFGETDEGVNKRALRALQSDIKPIICIGETDEERAGGQTEKVLERQTRAAFAGVKAEQIEKIAVAYEPVWAIGTGKNAGPEEAEASVKFIRGIIASLYGRPAANRVRILYGGSMNSKNCDALLQRRGVNGGLIGGASLKADDFTAIIKAAQ